MYPFYFFNNNNVVHVLTNINLSLEKTYNQKGVYIGFKKLTI